MLLLLVGQRTFSTNGQVHGDGLAASGRCICSLPFCSVTSHINLGSSTRTSFLLRPLRPRARMFLANMNSQAVCGANEKSEAVLSTRVIGFDPECRCGTGPAYEEGRILCDLLLSELEVGFLFRCIHGSDKKRNLDTFEVIPKSVISLDWNRYNAGMLGTHSIPSCLSAARERSGRSRLNRPRPPPENLCVIRKKCIDDPRRWHCIV